MRLNIIAAAAFAATISPALAFWRLPCRGRLGVARLDPLVNPDAVSSHAHVIHGASNFGMSVTVDGLLNSECTSCAVKEDKSIYWTPAAYFRFPNGDTELVEQVGGMLVYYLPRGENVQAFPKGFRMLAGDPYQRNFTWPVPDPPKSSWSGAETSQYALSQKAIGFNCLNYRGPAEPTLFRHTLPTKSEIDAKCPDGIRMEMMFPSCWNGKDLDTPDHKSHMAYPNLVEDGHCPKGFETRLVSLLYETIWNTGKYRGVAGEFVLSNGDPHGSGYHADFIEAWEPGFLAKAVKTCTNLSGRVEDCPLFTLQSEDVQNKCKFKIPDAVANEDCSFIKGGLPGNVKILAGPAYAKLPEIKIPEIKIPEIKIPEIKIPENNAAAAPPPPPPPPAPVEPTTTPAPAPGQFFAPNEHGDGIPISTSTYTEGNVVYEVVIMEEKVTTTVELPAGATLPAGTKAARKLHKRHGHGGHIH
ncbi:hypothetical protein AJ78_05180 [Emergomyces pasteurianus Ep9510]|uniref:DUF1996 domain-containing protein n=1 Tax=Emergomyces pasteurianus Ep9510 TaxID=1447872 RepID=A0A1J9QGZ6_9EURO|nr:hypothetical protein AJ78_05180 [Emergomyces pasteurianus Ep9510]